MVVLDHVAIEEFIHGLPQPSPGFDFTDPDVNVKGLPVDELAELRKDRADLVERAAYRQGRLQRRRLLGGDQAQGRQGGVAAQRRLPAWQNARSRSGPDDMQRENIDVQRFVMLNMDAPHHTRLRKIISRGFTPRAIGRLQDELTERAQSIAKAAAAEGSGDFVEQVSCELPLQAIAGLLGVPRGPRRVVPLVQRDDRRRGPRVRAHRRQSTLGRTDHVRHEDGRNAKNPGDDIVTALIKADIDGEKLSDDEFGFFVVMLAVAGNETTRNLTAACMRSPSSPISGSCTRRSARRPPPTRSCGGPRR